MFAMLNVFLLLVIFLSLLWASLIRIPANHLGLPESIFSGRYKDEVDEVGGRIPIAKPLKEGLVIKPPYWKIHVISQEVMTRRFEGKKYQTKESEDTTGLSVFASGMLQYRVSGRALFRVLEVDESAIIEGLDAEIDNVLADVIGKTPFDEVITLRDDLSKAVKRRFCDIWEADKINASDDDNKTDSNLSADKKETRRIVFGEPLTNSEVSYGIEVLKVSIDELKIPEEVEKERANRKKESLEEESQRIEWQHLMRRAEELKRVFPDVNEDVLLRAIQLWQKQIPSYDYREVKIDSKDSLSPIVAGIAGLLKGGGQRNDEK